MMKKSKIEWSQEFAGFSESRIFQREYCRKRGIQYATFRYRWARRKNVLEEDRFLEIPRELEVSSASADFLTFKIDGSGKVHLQINL